MWRAESKMQQWFFLIELASLGTNFSVDPCKSFETNISKLCMKEIQVTSFERSRDQKCIDKVYKDIICLALVSI